MIYFVGAGPGAEDLITVRGAELLKEAGIIVYAGSLVNVELVRKYARKDCEIHDSSHMTLDEIINVLADGHRRKVLTVRLHSGDPAIYGAVREQFRALRERDIPFKVVPGVSSLFGASAALQTEYMIPGGTQTLIITRLDGRTKVPERERLRELAKHGASIAVFLSAGKVRRVCEELIAGGYDVKTPAAVVYKATWPEEIIIKASLKSLPEVVEGITKSALILVGEFLNDDIDAASRLYDEAFSHEYRNGSIHP